MVFYPVYFFFFFFPATHTLYGRRWWFFFLLSVRRWRRCVLRLVHIGVFAETDGEVFGDSADVPDRRLDFASIFSMSDSSRRARHSAAQAEANRRAGTAAPAPAAAAAEVPGAAPEGSEAAGGARLPPAKRLQVDVGVDGKSVFCFLFFFFFFHRFMFSVAHFVVCIPVVFFLSCLPNTGLQFFFSCVCVCVSVRALGVCRAQPQPAGTMRDRLWVGMQREA